MFTTFPPHCRYAVDVGWSWKRLDGSKMVNRVASTVPVSRRVECLAKCTRSAVCDSFNYRPDDKTCQLNTYESSVGRSTLMQSPPTGLFRPRPLSSDWSTSTPTKRGPYPVNDNPHSKMRSTVLLTRRSSSEHRTVVDNDDSNAHPSDWTI